MFKYLILAGLEDILIVFDSAGGRSMDSLEPGLVAANKSAGRVWKFSKERFAVRLHECKKIVDPALKGVFRSELETHNAVPGHLGDKLDEIFTKYYQKDSHLLIGRAEDEAMATHDTYAREIINSLAPESGVQKSRAFVRLGKVYGYTSIPLLCARSIETLWVTICCSAFYKRQLSLVSLTHPPADSFSNFQTSSTGGSIHLQSLWGTMGSGVTTCHPSNVSS